jgi:hypothetical protein
MPSPASKREMNRIQKLIEQREKIREETRSLNEQMGKEIALKLGEQKRKAMMKGIRRVFEQSKKTMSGIWYLVDEKGRRVAVQIDLTKHQELWYYVEDWLISRTWRDAAQSVRPAQKRRRPRVLKRLSAKPARGR